MATAAILAAVGLAITIRFPTATPMVAVVGLIVVAVAVWMVLEERYEWTLVVLLLYIGLADGYLKQSTGSPNATLVRDVLLYAIVAGALARIAVRRESVSLPPLAGWIIAWVVVVAIQVVNPNNGTMMHSLAAVRPHAEFVPLFFLAYFVLRSKARIRHFLFLLVAVAAINGLVGLVQANMTPEELSAWGPGYERAINGEGENSVSARGFSDNSGEARNRPFALGADSGFGGIVGMLAVPAALALLALARHRRLRILTAILSAGVVLAVATSASRTAVLGSAVAIFAFAALTVTSRGGLRTVFAVGAAVAVIYAGIGLLTSGAQEGSFDRYDSISNPSEAVSTSFDYRKSTLAKIPGYMVEFPLGSGIGRNGPAASVAGGPGPGFNAESEPNFLLIELGIPGLVVIFGLYITLMYLSATRIRRIADKEARVLLTALAAPLFAIFAVGFAGITTAGVPNSPYLWFVAGALAFWLLGDGNRRLKHTDEIAEPGGGPPPPTPHLSGAHAA